MAVKDDIGAPALVAAVPSARSHARGWAPAQTSRSALTVTSV